MSFLDELVKLNQQNFLGGAVKFGEAVKEEQQDAQIQKLWNQFQATNNKVMSKDETATAFKDYVDKNKVTPPTNNNTTTDTTQKFSDIVPPGATEDIKGGSTLSNISNTPPTPPTKEEVKDGYDKTGLPITDQTVKATLDLQKYISNIQGLQKSYTPYLTAFSLLGEKGQQVAGILNNELHQKMQIEQMKAEEPAKELQYQTELLQFKNAQNQLADYYVAKKETEESKQIMSLMYGSRIFTTLSKYQGNWNTHSMSTKAKMVKEYENDTNNLVGAFNDLYVKKYGYQPDARLLQGALQSYVSTLGININYSEKESTGSGNGIGVPRLSARDYAVHLTQMTKEYNSSPIRKAYDKWVNTSSEEDKSFIHFMGVQSQDYHLDTSEVQKFYDKFKAEGVYENTYNTLRYADLSTGKEYFAPDGYPKYRDGKWQGSNGKTRRPDIPDGDNFIYLNKQGALVNQGQDGVAWNPTWGATANDRNKEVNNKMQTKVNLNNKKQNNTAPKSKNFSRSEM